MNEIVLLGIGAFFGLLSTVLSGLLFHALRAQRDRFAALEAEIKRVDAKANENVEALAFVRGRFGELGPIRNWRE